MDDNSNVSTYIIAFGSAAAGALIGSLATYILGCRQQETTETNRRHGALINTQFALFSQWKLVDGIRGNLLDPVRNDPNRFGKIRPAKFIRAQLSVPLSELAFIANSETPNLIQEISDAEYAYLKTMLVLELFNEYHSQLTNAYPPIPGTFDSKKSSGQISAPKHEFDIGNFHLENLYEQVDKAGPKIKQTIESIAGFVKKEFKGKKAIKLVPEQVVRIKQ